MATPSTALVDMHSTLEVTNLPASPPAVEQWAEQGLAQLRPLVDARDNLQMQLLNTGHALIQTWFDIGDCLIDISASVPKNRGRFGSNGWRYFTKLTEVTFGLDETTASQYMSIARSGELRKRLAEGAFNGEGRTTLYELARIDSSDTFAEIKRQKYLTPGGPRLPHSKAEAWRQEYEGPKKSAKQKAGEKNEKGIEKRAAQDRLARETAARAAQLLDEAADQETIIPDDVTPPVDADPTEGEVPGEVQTDNIELAGRFKPDANAPVTLPKTQKRLVHFCAPPCTERELKAMQKRLELNFKNFQDEFPVSAGYYVIVKLTHDKPADLD